MGLWKFYRVDFASTGSTTTANNQTPSNSFEWTRGQWVRRRADSPIDVSNAISRIFMQIDTASTDIGNNAASSADINILAAAIPDASTGIIGGRFDNSSLGYFQMINGIPDNLRKSVNLTSTFAETLPIFKLRYDRNVTSVDSYCSVFIGFKESH